MYPLTLPDADKMLWSHDDCFSVNTRVLARGFLHSNYQINMHRHDFYELNVVTKGKGVHYINNRPFLIEEGDTFVIPSGFKHGYYMQEELDVFHLLIHKNFFVKYRHELEALPGYVMLLTVEPGFGNEMNFRYFLKLGREMLDLVVFYLTKISYSYEKESLESPVLINSLALHLITLLCMLYRRQYNIDKNEMNNYFSAILKSIEFIYVEFANKISVDDLVKISSMSRSTFIRVFFKVTGITPCDFITNYRIQQAKLLLLNSDKAIAEIANTVGFYDAPHLDRVFKMKTGVTPKEYRYSH